MRTIETILYKFDELSETAKSFAINEYIENYFQYNRNYDFDDEISASFKKAEEIYDSLENIEGEIKGARLYTWLINNVASEWIRPDYFCFDGNDKIIHNDFSYKYTQGKYKKSRVFETNNTENCPLTGVCYDFEFLEPIINFLKKPDSLTTNLGLAKLLPSFDSVCQNDYEYRTTKEYISEELINNETEFYENGKEY